MLGVGGGEAGRLLLEELRSGDGLAGVAVAALRTELMREDGGLILELPLGAVDCLMEVMLVVEVTISVSVSSTTNAGRVYTAPAARVDDIAVCQCPLRQVFCLGADDRSGACGASRRFGDSTVHHDLIGVWIGALRIAEYNEKCCVREGSTC